MINLMLLACAPSPLKSSNVTCLPTHSHALDGTRNTKTEYYTSKERTDEVNTALPIPRCWFFSTSSIGRNCCAVVGDGVRSLFHYIPWSAFSLNP